MEEGAGGAGEGAVRCDKLKVGGENGEGLKGRLEAGGWRGQVKGEGEEARRREAGSEGICRMGQVGCMRIRVA